jgi:hypothetical protein
MECFVEIRNQSALEEAEISDPAFKERFHDGFEFD